MDASLFCFARGQAIWAVFDDSVGVCIVIEFETNESACLLHVRDYSARCLVNDAVCCSKLTATWRLLHVRLTSVPVLTRLYRDIRKFLSIKHYHYLAYMAWPRQLLR